MSAPEVFDQDLSGRVALITERPETESRAAVRAAIAMCPAEALRLVED
jgi:ferredoxin